MSGIYENTLYNALKKSIFNDGMITGGQNAIIGDGVVGSDGKSPVVDLSGIEAAMQENTSALKNLKQLNLNIDHNGLAVWQQDASRIVNR